MKNMENNVIRTLILGDQVSLTIADTTEIVREGKRLHGLTKGGAETLGKFLSAAVFMSAALKEESGEISFAFQSDGEGQLCNVSGNHALRIRGYLENSKADGGEREILGKEGSFTVIRDDGYSRPFVGSCALPENPTVDEILEEYYLVSEQLPTFFGSVVDFDGDEVSFAGIAVLQPLPFTEDSVVESLPKGERLREIVRKIPLLGIENVAKTEFSANTPSPSASS